MKVECDGAGRGRWRPEDIKRKRDKERESHLNCLRCQLDESEKLHRHVHTKKTFYSAGILVSNTF